MKTTDPYNYVLAVKDVLIDSEACRILCVLRFHERPQGNGGRSDEAADLMEEEEAAIGLALEREGICLQSATPESDYSPTGRWYWNEPMFDYYGTHVVVTQSGGLDT